MYLSHNLLTFPTVLLSAGKAVIRWRTALIITGILAVLFIALSIYLTSLVRRAARRRKHASSAADSGKTILRCSYAVAGVFLLVSVFSAFRLIAVAGHQNPQGAVSDTTAGAETTQETDPGFTPITNQQNDPANLGVKWEIIDHGVIVNSYQREDSIRFGSPEEFYPLPGISTFRGNNYRNSPAYGSANVTEKKLTELWNTTIGSLNGWPGTGWTGQPLIVQWDAETKAIMNLYEEKKADPNLIEVIYATLDGHVYFYDLADGSRTRDPINLGMNFKGAGSLDPRGYPILYVGSGDKIGETAPRMYIVSLIDGTILYERSGKDSFAQREWVAFDSAPLVDAETDTLIWPGESGILYTIKLNTNFDKAAGTLTMSPEETVKTRYTTPKYTKDGYWIGFEPGAVIVDQYLFTSDNGGIFFCIDLNTMKPIWATDTKDDSNSTPVFQTDDQGNTYLYTAPSLHWTASNHDDLRDPSKQHIPGDAPEETTDEPTEDTRPTTGTGTISVYKLNAKTGEIIWQVPFDCHTVEGVSGGVQSSPLLGAPGTELEGMILYTIARTPDVETGKLVAFNTDNGEIVWELPMDKYAWSSPVAVYNQDGTAYIILCDAAGNISLLDSQGKVLSTMNLGSNIEASPAVFNDTLVVGTRGGKIYGIKIS